MLKKTSFESRGNPTLSIEDFALKLRENGDFWRMHLDYCKSGMNNELGVYSHRQKAPDVTTVGNETTISYSGLIAEDGSVHNIKLVLKIIQRNGALYFSADMENNGDVRINELQYPFFEFEKINENSECDELIVPEGLGRSIKNPHDSVKSAHTEYMAADYKNIWSIYSYPGQMSMPWFGIQSGGKYLYMGWHSEIWRRCSFAIGTEPRESDDKYVIYTISSYPAVNPGEKILYDNFVLAGFDGDWRNGADFYRTWADNEWHHPVRKNGAKQIMGWQRVILKHQYGEIFHTYNDLPRIYKEGAEYGINMILLFAWWKEGMDNGYPNYEPDPDLGGGDMLKKAIEEINEMGGIVVLYANGHLIDASTDYYKNEGIKYTVKDIERNEYREFYKFSNNGTLLRYGHKTFATGCHGTEKWREKLLEIEKKHLSLGSNGTFFDQLGCCFNFCFDDTHEHGRRIDLDPEFRLKTIKEMKKILGNDQYFGTEWTIDRISEEVDFVHGCGFGQNFSEDAYPYVFKYTFPDVLISNRFLHDEREGWKRDLNYAFTFGLIFDVSIYRGRAESVNIVPEYAAYVKKLIDFRKKYLEFFTEGALNMPSVSIPEGVKAAEYRLNGKCIMTVWNDSDEAVEMFGKTIPSDSVDILEPEN
ncbi:MAG: DUF6259 domain-containing protein [Clostridiales bacterium]|nr:DUF6259 domain-containing protein [Clostridiales bacterium]